MHGRSFGKNPVGRGGLPFDCDLLDSRQEPDDADVSSEEPRRGIPTIGDEERGSECRQNVEKTGQGWVPARWRPRREVHHYGRRELRQAPVSPVKSRLRNGRRSSKHLSIHRLCFRTAARSAQTLRRPEYDCRSIDRGEGVRNRRTRRRVIQRPRAVPHHSKPKYTDAVETDNPALKGEVVT